MSFNAICKSKDENINELCLLFRALNKSVGDQEDFGLFPEEYGDNLIRSKKVFGLMMRAFFRKNNNDKFQPCQDELDFLKGMVEAVHLCHDLRNRASPREFYQLLLPGGWVQRKTAFAEGLVYETGIEFLNKNDSIFHIDQHNANDRKEYEDLEKRAETLAVEIKQKVLGGEQTKEVQILDGHGRIVVLLLKALEERHLYLEYSPIKLKVFEIDEIVHEYHKYVFHNEIDKVKGCIINQSPLPRSGVIYLNFCSIQSTSDFDWTTHFKEPHVNNVFGYNLACVKENVLRFIAESTGFQYNCTVMISLIIRHNHHLYIYQAEFKKTLGDYLTGLGFLYVLRNDFDAEIVSIRPDYEIEWDNPKVRRIPKKLHSGGKGCPFVTLLVKPGDYRKKLEDRFKRGCHFDFTKKEKKIADLKEDTIQKGVPVKVVSGKNKGKEGKVISRTAAKARVELRDRTIINPNLQQIVSLL